MFEQISEWVQGHRLVVFVIGLALVGALGLVLATGLFQIEIGQFFAFQCANDTDCGSGQYCTSGGSCVSGTNPNVSEPCVPVSAPSWTGGTNACVKDQAGIAAPLPPPNWLPHVTLENIGGLPSLATNPPYGSANGYTCFGFTIPDGNAWASIDATSGGAIPATKGRHTLTGQFWNNCPWPVEMTGGAAGSPKAGSDYIFRTDGTVDEPLVGLDASITRNTTQPIPSCWNYPHITGTNTNTNTNTGGGNQGGAGPENIFDWESSPVFPISRISDYLGRFFGIRALAQQAGCNGTYSITLDLGSFNAGRIEASLGWKHYDQVGTASGNTTVQDGYNIVANSGRNCSNAPGEFCAGQGAGGIGVGGATGGTTGTTGPGPGGAFNCGTGSGSDGCWCGEWTDAIWAQRHAAAAHSCNAGYVLTPEYKAFLAQNVTSFDPAGAAPDGTSDGDILDWSNSAVQNFINIMEDNYSGGNQGCRPRASGVDYAGIQQAYWAIGQGGIGLSGNGSSAVAQTCSGDVAVEPAQLHATCQSGPSVRLDWNIPVGAVTNALIKRVDGGDGQFIEAGIGRLTTNYTDGDVQAGHAYQYQHKAHASVASDPVNVTIDANGTCRVQGVAASPAPTITSTPTPTSVAASPTPTPVVSVTPAPGGTGDSDGDGIPDFTECPTASQGYCRDSDGDGIPDFQDPGIGAASQTPTGPAAATFLAFILASLTALLYVSYTHTALFRRHEAQKVSGDDRMDFRP